MNRKQKIWVAIAFLLVLLFSGVANMPAQQLLRVVQIPPTVKIYGLHGTLTRVNIDQLQVQGVTLSDVRLQWQALCLLQAAVCYRLQSDDHKLKANLQYSLFSGEMSVEQGSATLDSNILQRVDSLLIKPKGVFDIDLETLVVKQGKLLDLQAKVHWRQAGIEGEEQLLGNYLATVTTSIDGFDIVLSDKDSLLKMKGQIQLQWSGDYNVDVKLVAQPGLKPSIKRALDLMAQRSGLGQYRMRKKGRLNARQSRLLNKIHPPEK